MDEYAMLVDQMAQLVLSSHLFKSLDDEGRKRALELGFVASFCAGDTLMKQGQPSPTMYLLLQGSVRVETETPSGHVQLAELGKNACVGEVGLLAEGPRTATVTAITDVDAVAFERDRLFELFEAYPQVREVLESLVEGRARDAIEKIVGSV